jgi:hypothetical protein
VNDSNRLQYVDYERLSDDALRSEFSKSLRAYKNWVDKKFEINDTWRTEIEYLSFHRGELHKMAELLMTRKIDIEFDALKKIDKQWQDWITHHTFRDANFKLEFDRKKIPKSHWWEWVDQLNELSAQERSTL